MENLRPRFILTDHARRHLEPVRSCGSEVIKCKALSETLAICCVGALLLCIVAPPRRHNADGITSKASSAGKVLRSALPDDSRDQHSVSVSGPVARIASSLDNIFCLSFSPRLATYTFFALKPLPGRAPPIA